MKEKFTKIYEFLIKPPKAFSLLCYGLFVLFSAISITLACTIPTSIVTTIFYSGMGVTFFYCAYLFIRYDYKKIRDSYRKTKAWLSSKSRFLNRLINDSYFSTMFSTILSLILGVGFVTYNAVAGLIYHSVWNGSISVYYGFLIVIRVVILASELYLHKNDLSDTEKELFRAKIFISEGVLLLMLNVALIAPVTILALSKKQVNMPMWVAIADASYTFYKVIACIYSFIKHRKNSNLSIKGIKRLNLTCATISILSLENTMILTFSENPSAMQLLMIMSALAVMLINLSVALLTYLGGKKTKENINKKEETI